MAIAYESNMRVKSDGRKIVRDNKNQYNVIWFMNNCVMSEK